MGVNKELEQDLEIERFLLAFAKALVREQKDSNPEDDGISMRKVDGETQFNQAAQISSIEEVHEVLAHKVGRQEGAS